QCRLLSSRADELLVLGEQIKMYKTFICKGIQMNTPSDELSELGKCLLQRYIYMTLLAICFNSLSWKDTINCQRSASVLCWTLLKQVLGCNLLLEAVTWLYTSVLKGLQMHGQHEGCNVALTQLALLIYESLVHHASSALISCHLSYNTTLLGAADRRRTKPLGQQFKKEVHIRNLPSLFKKPKPTKDMLENTDTAGLIALFSSDHDSC
uniref:Exportin-5 C-terminal domain-containing protein n=1 Tax=Sinocyclocheilus rhinocerous TaxID=307959 RepID=A0A673KHZ0_9TELE